MTDRELMKKLEIKFKKAWLNDDRKEMLFYELQLNNLYKKINGNIQTDNGK